VNALVWLEINPCMQEHSHVSGNSSSIGQLTTGTGSAEDSHGFEAH